MEKLEHYGEEHRKRISDAVRGKWKDPATREKMTPKPGIHPWKKQYREPRKEI